MTDTTITPMVTTSPPYSDVFQGDDQADDQLIGRAAKLMTKYQARVAEGQRFDDLMTKATQAGPGARLHPDDLKAHLAELKEKRNAHFEKFLGDALGAKEDEPGELQQTLAAVDGAIDKELARLYAADPVDVSRVTTVGKLQVEQAARRAGNLQEFMTWGDKQKDPAVVRAYQLYAGDLAQSKWRDIPATGGFAANLAKAYEASFRNAKIEKLETERAGLKDVARYLADVGRTFDRVRTEPGFFDTTGATKSWRRKADLIWMANLVEG